MEKGSYKINPDAPLEGTEVFLDPNVLSEDGTSSIGTKVWSDDGRYLAYQINVGGSDWATIYVRDAETGKDLESDVLKWVKFSGMSWTKDNKGFFYGRFESPESQKKDDMKGAGTETDKLKDHKIYYHRVGTK